MNAVLRMLAWLLAIARRHPSAWLLAVQLLGVLLYPAMDESGAGRALFGAFGILVLALALWVVNRSAAVNWIAWSLAVPAVLPFSFEAADGHPMFVTRVEAAFGDASRAAGEHGKVVIEGECQMMPPARVPAVTGTA